MKLTQKQPSLVIVIACLGIGLLAIWSLPAYADVGPPPVYSQGGILQTDTEATSVSMADEKVVLKYGQPEGENDWDMIMPVHVKATFTMRNTGANDETLQVYFPTDDSSFISGYNGEYGIVTNFTVNGQLLSKDDIAKVGATIDGKAESISAYQWSETFPAGEDTNITISYDGASGKDYEVYYLTYVLGTGRGWKGPIGKGTVSFELPDTLTDYSVVSDVPLVSENELPFIVSGNTITITFQNYEPEPDAVVMLGVYDFDLVKQSEDLMGGAANFENTLTLAGVLRQLSGGPHCLFCTGKAAEMAPKYYMDALDLATSESELDQVLVSFMYGDQQFHDDWTPPSAEETKASFSFPDCEPDDTTCRYNAYIERGYFGGSVFRRNWTTGELENEEFLTLYSDKTRQYNSAVADTIDAFIQEAPDAYAWYAKENNLTLGTAESADTENVDAININAGANTNTNTNGNIDAVGPSEEITTPVAENEEENNWYLLLGLGCAIVILFSGYLILKNRK